MRYREYPPPADLRPWVQCLWTGEPATTGAISHRVLPDGCIDILLEANAAGEVESSVVGMMTRPLVIERSGSWRMTAARFKPGGAAAFWRGPLDRLTDLRVELREVWPRPTELVDRVASAAGETERLDLLVAELRRRLGGVGGVAGVAGGSGAGVDGGARRGHAGCRLAIRQLVLQPETGVRELCAQLGVSRQALARSFREHVGVSPKTLGRVLRLQRALRLIEPSAAGGLGGGAGPAGEGQEAAGPAASGARQRSFADLAADAGFYDQSHMIAEWRELVGLTPSAYLAERRVLTGEPA